MKKVENSLSITVSLIRLFLMIIFIWILMPQVDILAATTINTATISGVTIPVTGANPDTTVDETAQYTATTTWLPADTAFKSSTTYTATITITPKTGYTLAGVPQNFFTVAGATATNDANSGIITAVFPTTSTTINIQQIKGVTRPVAGATPDTTVDETAQYTATTSWSPVVTTFFGDTQYTATITITPKTGYTLIGVPTNYFKLDGILESDNIATLSNTSNSGVVTAVFTKTDPVVINIPIIDDCRMKID